MSLKKRTAHPSEETRKFCPFIEDPFEDCYVCDTGSWYTEATIKYCGGNFEDCAIYQKNTRGKHWSKWNVLI
jgi:hypothetical protein